MTATYPVMDQAELLDVANDAIILTDAHGTITYWNQGACGTYGWEKKEALGQNLHALLRTQLSRDARNLESSLKEQSHWEGELEGRGWRRGSPERQRRRAGLRPVICFHRGQLRRLQAGNAARAEVAAPELLPRESRSFSPGCGERIWMNGLRRRQFGWNGAPVGAHHCNGLLALQTKRPAPSDAGRLK